MGYSNTVTGFLTLIFFITKVALSYTGPWNLLFGAVGLVNVLWKFWLIITSCRSDRNWKLFRTNWTQLLSNVILTLLYFHYGGLI